MQSGQIFNLNMAFYWGCPKDTPCIVAKIGITFTVSKITIEHTKKKRKTSPMPSMTPVDESSEREQEEVEGREGGSATSLVRVLAHFPRRPRPTSTFFISFCDSSVFLFL